MNIIKYFYLVSTLRKKTQYIVFVVYTSTHYDFINKDKLLLQNFILLNLLIRMSFFDKITFRRTQTANMNDSEIAI